MTTRSCDGCTKCCEGWLITNVEDQPIFRGSPCKFVSIGKGCTRHETRPEDPCRVFHCAWITDVNIPEYLKPDSSNVILIDRELEGNYYLAMFPAGGAISSSLLSWFITYGLTKYGNVYWETELFSRYYLGSPQFSEAMAREIASKVVI